jgi:phage tail sheath protein FI
MPVRPSYPGVYVDETASGVRSIEGVPTSVTAFLGRFRRGPVNEPVSAFGFGDFERRFSGLWAPGPASYAVNDFFANGGSQAIIVRLFRQRDANDGVATLAVGNLSLVATDPGEWGNGLSAVVGYPADSNAVEDIAVQYGLAATDLFDLAVVDASTNQRELFSNVTVKADGGARRLDRVLEAGSSLVRVALSGGSPQLPDVRPAEDAAGSGSGGNDGDALTAADMIGDANGKRGLHALLMTDIFNVLVIPPDTRDGTIDPAVWEKAAEFCAERRAFLLVDPPAEWDDRLGAAVQTVIDAQRASPVIPPAHASHAALFFPRYRRRDPLNGGQLTVFTPSGMIAGIMARTDATRGVWKAASGLEATLSGADGLTVKLTDAENGLLNPIAVNCLRSFPGAGYVVWGARTLRGADQFADAYKYIPVRRLALFIEESLVRGTKWVVFSPNEEPLWAQIRLNVGAFMQQLFRQGAFQGTTPRDAYFVKCDAETTTQDDIDRRTVNIVVGFAPLKPAEFVIIRLQQILDGGCPPG